MLRKQIVARLVNVADNVKRLAVIVVTAILLLQLYRLIVVGQLIGVYTVVPDPSHRRLCANRLAVCVTRTSINLCLDTASLDLLPVRLHLKDAIVLAMTLGDQQRRNQLVTAQLLVQTLMMAIAVTDHH